MLCSYVTCGPARAHTITSEKRTSISRMTLSIPYGMSINLV